MGQLVNITKIGFFQVGKAHLMSSGETFIGYIEYYDYFVMNVGFQITFSPNHNIINVKNFFENNNILKNIPITFNSVYQDDLAVKYKVHAENMRKIQALYQAHKVNLISSIRNAFMDTCFKRELLDSSDIFYRPLYRFYKFTSSCYPGCQKIFVSSDGQFHACEKINRFFPIGSYENGIDLKKVASVWNQYYSSVCKNCSSCISAQLCHVCLATAAKNGYFDATKQCNYFREKLPKLFKEYIDIVEQCPNAFK